MSTTPAILALVATLAAGIAAGLLFLQRKRRGWVGRAHLLLALAGLALAALAVLGGRPAPGGPPAALPPGLLAAATLAGFAAPRLARRGYPRMQLLLAGHLLAGIAGFLVFLAWARNG
ncbi:hypothetical protein [Falsiroseomonas selenitidurans]|uniref:Uncharacterized protein n=1 Tax=Falsiroseomonas selenitidurans TaxID=2716335 RepID=A0ABX1ED39_9PROT|nr:hypothetical protein [Falsiroseomonas selenitidurans]NKC33442.1 hypothetical protein [Falsiroseomonas selenitidurans]